MKNKFEVGDFALLQGYIVRIVQVKAIFEFPKTVSYIYQVRLWDDNLFHWIEEGFLEKLPSQDAPKVLYSKK